MEFPNHNQNGHDDDMEWQVGDGRPGTSNPRGGAHDVVGYPTFPEEESEAATAFDLDWRRFVIGAWQRRYLAVASAAGIFLLMLTLITYGISRHWQSSVTLIKRSHQDRLSLAERDPFKVQDYNLATLLDTLKLPSSLETVREKAGLKVSLTSLATAIDVSLGRDSKILNLKLTWNDREKSAELANLMAETFIDRTRRLLSDDARNAFDYYSAQLDGTRRDAIAASTEVVAFQQENGISDLDAETKVLLEEMSRLQAELASRRAEAEALQVAHARLAANISGEPEQVITYTIYRSPLKNRLSEYEWELQELRSKYTDQNPKVIKVNERIDALKRMIAANNDEAVPENTYTRNTKREEMELRLQELTDEIRMREAQAEALERTLDDMGGKLAALSSKEKDYLLLQSRLDGILALENELGRRVEETRLVMQRNDASFAIVERAVAPTNPLPSGKKLLAAVSLLFSLGGSVSLVLLLELLDPRIRSLRDVRDIVGDSNILEIPAAVSAETPLVDPMQPISNLAGLFRRLGNDMDASGDMDSQLPLAVVSLEPGAGRSTVAANLALTRLMKGQRVRLVDADLRTSAGPRPGELLQLPAPESGLYEHLLDGMPLETSSDPTGRLELIAASASGCPADDRGLLAMASHDLSRLVAAHKDDRRVLVDLPPLQDLEVAMELTGRLGQALLVIRSGINRRDELRRIMGRLEKRGIRCVGVILLDVPEPRLETAPLIKITKPGRVFGTRGVNVHA
jgi:uncharacterized protein involved in exopolysaccharide biosynthesis/Mrp family chromosome partitioning ATPase